MSKRPTILVMTGGSFVGHIFLILAVAENLQIIKEGVSSV